MHDAKERRRERVAAETTVSSKKTDDGSRDKTHLSPKRISKSKLLTPFAFMSLCSRNQHGSPERAAFTHFIRGRSGSKPMSSTTQVNRLSPLLSCKR